VFATVVPTVLPNMDIKCSVMFDVSAPLELNNDIVQFSDTSTSNIVVLKMGQSMILSGLSNESLEKIRTGVPYLRRIPVLSFFFSDKNKTRVSQDLVIVITPRPACALYDASCCGYGLEPGLGKALRHIQEDNPRTWDSLARDQSERIRSRQPLLPDEVVGEAVDLQNQSHYGTRASAGPAYAGGRVTTSPAAIFIDPVTGRAFQQVESVAPGVESSLTGAQFRSDYGK
jgi:hypothetical protein